MEFKAAVSDICKQKSDCLVIAIFENKKLSLDATRLDKHCNGAIQAVLKSGDLKGKVGESLLIHNLPNCSASRVLLLGFGHRKGCSPKDFTKAAASAAAALNKTKAKSCHIYCNDVVVTDRDQSWQLQQLVQQFSNAAYLFQQLKSVKKPAFTLSSTTLCIGKQTELSNIKKALTKAVGIAEGCALAKDLGNLPGNICTPPYLSEQAKKLAKNNTNFSTKILGEKQMEQLGMGSLLSVAAGSREPAQLIIMEYNGAGKKGTTKPIVLVGKGITFDTGGISLKGGAGMDEMKFDMCGAASVFGAMKALQIIKPKINVIGIVAAAENMPSGEATKPGDIVTSMAGKTIEVLNTDAEGRLVLCDALTYAERFKPKAVVDIATLTGACVVALGRHASGLYSNRDELAAELLAAGEYSGDRAWQMPLWDDYKSQLDSNFADLANIGGPQAGSVTAACFLSHFTESYPWAHLDIAGTAWNSNAEKGATGRPVPLLVNYILGKL
ncbi:leucyl aminopeptidase [Aurantivibrio infirmus]